MDLIARFTILIGAFFVMKAFLDFVPILAGYYRDRYQRNMQQTSRELNKFFLSIKPGKIIIGAFIVGVALGVLTGNWIVGVAVCVAGVFAPKIILAVWKDIRSTHFEGQLVDALLLMGNTLKSGMDIAAGVERIALDMKPPISEEFGLVLNSYRLGTPLEMALLDLTHRIRSRTLETVVHAINIQRETGGNIIKTFDQIVLTIREENKLQKKVRAITSQGRTQIVFMALFPWAMALLFFFMAPDFMRPALANPWGQATVLFLVVWEVIGILITRKIATVDI
jgi:tight adherence protein B